VQFFLSGVAILLSSKEFYQQTVKGRGEGDKEKRGKVEGSHTMVLTKFLHWRLMMTGREMS